MQSATCLTFTGPNSSYIRLRSTLNQVGDQDQIHTVFYRVLHWLSLSASYLVADIIIWRLEMFQTINLDQTVMLEHNNLDMEIWRLWEL